MRQISFDFLRHHKILALALSRGWLEDHPLLNKHEQAFARERLALNIRREALMRSLLSEIAVRARDFQVGLLKGPALWGDLYRPGERESCDIDLFVSENDLAPLLEALSDLGYRAFDENGTKSRLHDFKTVCLSDRFGDLSVEIHTKLWWLEPRDFSWRWRPGQPAPLVRLTPEDQLLHLCGHWIAQHTMISLHWMFDIVLFMDAYREQIDRASLQDRAQRLRLGRAVNLALRICDDFARGEPSRLRSFLTVDLDFLLEPRHNLLRYFLIKHAVQETWADAFRYDLNWLRERLGRPA